MTIVWMNRMHLAGLAACFLALMVSAVQAETVSGSALYRERMSPPPDARFVVVFEDVSRADAPAVEIGKVEYVPDGGPPYAFAIDYDPAVIDPSQTYVVRASLRDGQGRLLFTTDTFTPVLTRGAPDSVEIVMVRVLAGDSAGDGALPAQIGAHGLQLPASFTGTLPCADCEGIAHHLDLWPDQTFHLRREWLGREGDTRRDDIGRWHADPARNAIVLSGMAESPALWEVKAHDRLRQLALGGSPIDTALPLDLVSDGTLHETDVEGLFLGGMMTYIADAAVFEECLTGRRYPIAMEGGYLVLERAYLADASAPGAPLYVHVEGSLLMRPAMEGPDRRSLVVKSLIRTRPGVSCERQRADPSLTNTYWRIDSLKGEAVTGLPERREPHLVLLSGDDQRFRATVGCNQMIGSYTQDGDALSFGPAAATMMACPPPLDGLERGLSDVLGEAKGFRLDGDSLSFLDAAGAVVAAFTAVYQR